MGAEPWFYFVDFQSDMNKALQQLREREFRAGRYNPAELFPRYPVDLGHSPGCQHASIDDAIQDADADGTRSILDIQTIAESTDFGVAAPLDRERLIELFGTDKPNRSMIESNFDLFEDIERGQSIYIVSYDGTGPSEIFFAGYSYD